MWQFMQELTFWLRFVLPTTKVVSIPQYTDLSHFLHHKGDTTAPEDVLGDGGRALLRRGPQVRHHDITK